MHLEQQSGERIEWRQEGQEQRRDSAEKRNQPPARKTMRYLPMQLAPASRVNQRRQRQSQAILQLIDAALLRAEGKFREALTVAEEPVPEMPDELKKLL